MTLFCWIFGSATAALVLIGTAHGSTSIYGPLAAPIAVLLWLYLLSIAVLIGAALNAAFDQLWPQKETARPGWSWSAGSSLDDRAPVALVDGWRSSPTADVRRPTLPTARSRPRRSAAE